jgi:hypothetical protein
MVIALVYGVVLFIAKQYPHKRGTTGRRQQRQTPLSSSHPAPGQTRGKLAGYTQRSNVNNAIINTGISVTL